MLRPLSLALVPLLAVLLLVVPSEAAAQVQLARLEGIVVDAANQAVGAAHITITDSVGGVVREATTDARGRFVVADLAPGRYAIAAAGGPPTARQAAPATVTLADGLPASIIVRLPPAFREALVVEGANPAASVASRTSIGAASIDRAPMRVRARGLQDAVATLPGWATEDNGLLHHRGVDDGFLYVVDGVPVYERLDQTSGLAPDARTVDALTVLSGYVPPEYGYKAGGVIELRTRAATDAWRGSAAVGGGSESSLDGEVSAGGGLGDHATVWLQGASQRSARFLDPVDPDNLHNTGSNAGLAGQLTAGSGADSRLVTSWQAARARFDVPNMRLQEAAGQAARQSTAQGAITTSWQRASTGTVAQLAGYVRRGLARLDPSHADTPITAESDRRLTRAGALASVARQRGTHLLKAGTEVQQLRIAEHFGFAVTDDDEAEALGLSDAALAFEPDAPFRFDGQTRPWLFSAYLQDTWQAAPALTVAAGLRFDRTRLLLSRQQWSPRLGLAFAASSHTTVRASVSRFYQPPQPEYLLLASSPEARELSPFLEDGGEGGADIEPERQWAFDAGVEHRFGRGWRLDVAGWDRRVDRIRRPQRVLRHDDHLPERGGLWPRTRCGRPAGDGGRRVVVRLRQPQRREGHTGGPHHGRPVPRGRRRRHRAGRRVRAGSRSARGGVRRAHLDGASWRDALGDGALRERHADRARRRRGSRRTGRSARRRARRLRRRSGEAAHDRSRSPAACRCGRRRVRR